MPVKIRLSRQGRKRIPYYHIVVADSRAPRDGKYIERLGVYYPKTNPATIEVNFERALYWLQTGAQPTDTCRDVLSEKGLLMKKHLLEGVKKKALTEEQAETKFQAWITEKEKKQLDKKESLLSGKADVKKARLNAESKVREAKAAAIAKKASAAVLPEVEASENAEA
jgi:small subunit ribosomal protein S16